MEDYEPRIISSSEGHIFKTSIFKSRKKILQNIAKIIRYDAKTQSVDVDISLRDCSIDGYYEEKMKKRFYEGFSFRNTFSSSSGSILPSSITGCQYEYQVVMCKEPKEHVSGWISSKKISKSWWTSKKLKSLIFPMTGNIMYVVDKA